MRISDWSSDVCSSDLYAIGGNTVAMGQNSTSNGDGSVAIGGMGQAYDEYNTPIYDENGDPVLIGTQAVVGSTAIGAGAQATGEVSTAVGNEIGRATCRERVCKSG